MGRQARAILPHLATCNDLFCNYDVTKLTGQGNIKRNHRCADKKELCKRIFLRYLHILFADFVMGGKTFLLPSKRHCEIRFQRMRLASIKHNIANGVLDNLDLLASDRQFYEIVFTIKRGKRFMNKPLHISHHLRDKIIEKASTGYKYC